MNYFELDRTDYFSLDSKDGGNLHFEFKPAEQKGKVAAHVQPPRGDWAPIDPRQGLDLRADGLWTSLCCETPFVHWTFGLEAFGLRLDAPPPVGVRWSDLVGERLAVGYDLEWEATGPVVPMPDGPGYRVPGRVIGEVQTVHERWAVDAPGDWSHWWAPAA